MFKTFVIRPCITRNVGFLMKKVGNSSGLRQMGAKRWKRAEKVMESYWIFNWTDWNRFWIRFNWAVWPLIKYLFLPLTTTCIFNLGPRSETNPILLKRLHSSACSQKYWADTIARMFLLVKKPNRAFVTNGYYLASDGELFAFFISNRTWCTITVIKHNRDASFGNPCLALFVNKFT